MPSWSDYAYRPRHCRAAELRHGLRHLWAPLLGPGGQTVFDVGPRRHHGALRDCDPGAAWQIGPRGTVLALDGSDDRIDCGQAADFQWDEPFSVAVWVYVGSLSSDYRALVCKAPISSPWNGWSLLLFGTRPDFSLTAYPPLASVTLIGKWLAAGAWYSIVATSDGSGQPAGLRLYANGEDWAYSASGGISGGSMRNSAPCQIAARDGPNWPLPCQVSAAAVWDRVLSAREALLLAEGPQPLLERTARKRYCLRLPTPAPYEVAAGEIFLPGAVAAQAYSSGAAAGQLNVAGAIAGVVHA